MAKGTAIIDVAADVMPLALASFPSTYAVVGSRDSVSPGTVRLVVESEDLAGHDMHVTCEMKDAGSTRIVRMVPCGRVSQSGVDGHAKRDGNDAFGPTRDDSRATLAADRGRSRYQTRPLRIL